MGWFYNLASVNSSAANIDIYLYEKKEKMGLSIRSQQVSEYKQIHLSHRKGGGRDSAGEAHGIMEAMRSLKKSCCRKKYASNFSTISESPETREEREYGEGAAGPQEATQAKEVLLYYCQRVFEK